MLYGKDETGGIKQLKLLPKTNPAISLYVGQQGVLEGKLWEVGSICVKTPLGASYGWTEYALYSADGNVCFLSEYDGHWILAKEIETGEAFDIDATYENGHGLMYNNEHYAIFNSTEEYKTDYAAGIFDHPVPTKGKAKDFIRMSHAVLLEKNDQEITYAFEARHISKNELKSAFTGITLPIQYGHGMLQPFPFDVTSFTIVLGFFGGLILLCELLLAGSHPGQRVAGEYVPLPDTVAEVSHISPSFTFTGIRKPIQIDLSAPVKNSWAAVDFCLVNEETKEERFGSVEVAYYFGREEGEDWSEGSFSPSIKICGVPPGRYHLTMQVTKKPNTPELNSLHYTVTAQASTSNNLLLALGILIAVVIAVFIWRHHFEQQRWMNSDFAPEEEEEY